MSNASSSLRKPRKTPLPGNISRNVPYRNYSSSESQMLNEINGIAAQERLKDIGGKSPRKDASPRSDTSGTGDHELISLMMSRLGQLEQKLQYRTKELTEKDKKIHILEEKVKILQKARDYSDSGRVTDLERKCLLLQQQVQEMEDFLADYGMVWIGEKSTLESDDNQEVSEMAAADDEDDYLSKRDVQKKLWLPEDSVPTDFKVDYDLVIENIRDLNSLAGEGVGKIHHTADGARLKMPDNIPLVLYANGILMFSGPFRPFSDRETQLFVTDITDGYFPSELQQRYPDGIPFDLTDKREVEFKDRLNKIFEGHAEALGGRPVHSGGQHSDTAARTVETRIPGRKLTREQFLNKLPAAVVKGGKVIDVKSAVGERISGDQGPSNITVVETEAVRNISDNMEHCQMSARTPKLTTLRIKAEKGDHTFILKMYYDELVSDIKLYLDKLRPKGAPSYDIVSTFPKEVYSDLSKSLEEAGLVPNATLHLKPKPGK